MCSNSKLCLFTVRIIYLEVAIFSLKACVSFFLLVNAFEFLYDSVGRSKCSHLIDNLSYQAPLLKNDFLDNRKDTLL